MIYIYTHLFELKNWLLFEIFSEKCGRSSNHFHSYGNDSFLKTQRLTSFLGFYLKSIFSQNGFPLSTIFTFKIWTSGHERTNQLAGVKMELNHPSAKKRGENISIWLYVLML